MFNATFKPGLLILLLFISSFISMAQQTLLSALDFLQNKQLISARESSLILEEQKRFDERKKSNSYPDEELTYLENYELLGLLVRAKKFSTAGSFSLLSISPAPASSRNRSLSQIHTEEEEFITKMYSAGLITDWTKKNLIDRNDAHQFAWEFEVALSAQRQTNEEYFLQKIKLKKFADQLLQTKVISTENYAKMMGKSEKGELHRFSELFYYLDFAIPISLAEEPSDSILFLNHLYRKTSGFFPGLQYDSIQFRIKKDTKESMKDFEVYKLITTVYQNGKQFSFAGYYGSEYKGKKQSPRNPPEQYYAVFNKMLANSSSPYRLHEVRLDYPFLGIIALTEEQFRQFNWTYDGALETYLSVSYEHYSQGLTQDRIELALKAYDSIGLFSHLSFAEKESGIREVGIREINNFSDILKSFKGLVFDIGMEYGIDKGQYKTLTLQIAGISKNHFHPVDIIDEYSYQNKSFRYGFRIKSNSYQVLLHQPDDWLDPKFWDLIEKAIRENDHEGQFHFIYPSDGMTAIYLTNQQYEFLLSHKLLEFSDPDLEK